jgi:manganese/iron transport system permease protein
MATSVAVGLLSIVAGLYLSFYLDLPTGPSIAMVATSLFALALLFSPEKGLIRRKSKLAPVPSAENSN